MSSDDPIPPDPVPPDLVIVLAAGQGTRMRSSRAKVLHSFAGRSLLGHVLAATEPLQPATLLVVVGHDREQVTEHLAAVAPRAAAVTQHQQRGTGHAVSAALATVPDLPDDATVLVLPGDTPLLTAPTLGRLLAAHRADGDAVTLLSAVFPDPTGYGRVLRDVSGAVERVVEDADASPAQRAVAEGAAGVYVFRAGPLRQALGVVGSDNAQGEHYLPDVVALIRASGARVGASTADPGEVRGVNDRAQLVAAHHLLNRRLIDAALTAGAHVVDPATTWLDADVTLSPECVIWPSTQLTGGTHVATGAHVGPNTSLTASTVGVDARVAHSVCEGAVIGDGATVGPFAFLRPGTRLGVRTKAGAFVEVKNAEIGDGSKVPHLSYVGDVTIGRHSNIGAATVFVNYDGVSKHHSVVGDHVRTGADNMFIAPVTVGDGAYTAAGSVIVDDVPPGALAVARARQRNVAGWTARRRPASAAAEAAAGAAASIDSASANATAVESAEDAL